MLNSFILFLASWGHIVIIVTILLSILWRVRHAHFSIGKKFREAGISIFYFGLLGGVALLFVSLLKWAFPVARPFVEMGIAPALAVSSMTSFPSGHAFVLAALAFGAYKFSRQLCIILAILAILVALCRVHLHLHTGLDIAAGYILGALFGYFFSVKFMHVDVLEDVWKKLR